MVLLPWHDPQLTLYISIPCPPFSLEALTSVPMGAIYEKSREINFLPRWKQQRHSLWQAALPVICRPQVCEANNSSVFTTSCSSGDRLACLWGLKREHDDHKCDSWPLFMSYIVAAFAVWNFLGRARLWLNHKQVDYEIMFLLCFYLKTARIYSTVCVLDPKKKQKTKALSSFESAMSN